MALKIPVLSVQNELLALELLKKLCEDNLARYPESYEHDVEKLKTGTLTYNERNCLIFRSSEKRVIGVDETV